jgi:hypothetical protein
MKLVKYSSVVWMILILVFLSSGCGVSTASSNPSVTKVSVSPEMQQKRLDFIHELITKGLIYKVEKSDIYAEVWVTISFMSLNIDDKNSFINVIWAYYISEDEKVNILILRDGLTGKEIGTYSENNGGLKFK